MTRNNKNAGSTMIEVMVAFLVVTMMIGLFSKVVTASVNMYRRSVEITENTEKFNEEYYKSTPDSSKMIVTNLLDESDQNAPIVLQIDGTDVLTLKKTKIVKCESIESKMRRYSIQKIEE